MGRGAGVPRHRRGLGAGAPGDCGPDARRPGGGRAGETHARPGPAEVVTEDGSILPVADVLPADLPIGYHVLRPLAGGPEKRLIVSPVRCRPPGDPTWGWAAQLYGVRSRRSWGLGDLGDL